MRKDVNAAELQAGDWILLRFPTQSMSSDEVGGLCKLIDDSYMRVVKVKPAEEGKVWVTVALRNDELTMSAKISITDKYVAHTEVEHWKHESDKWRNRAKGWR